MDTITPSKTKYYRVPNNKELIKFYIRPNIHLRRKLLDENRVILLEVTYTLNCIFQKTNKPLQIFASALNEYTISREDNSGLDNTSETVFKCVQMIESDFNGFLTKWKGYTLAGFGIKPLTYELWAKGGSQIDIQSSAN